MCAGKLWQTRIESALAADRFDLMEWNAATRAIPQLDVADQQAANDLCGHPVQDGFLSLYKSSPRLADPTPAGLEPLADLLRRGMGTPEWGRLRDTCTGDTVAAGVGAQAFIKEVIAALPEEAKEQARQQAQKQEQANQAEAQADALTALSEMLNKRSGEKLEADPRAAESLQAQAQEAFQRALEAQAQADAAREGANAAHDAYQASADAHAAQIAAACNKAARAAQERASEASETVHGFSLAAGGDPAGVDPDTARAAMQALQRNPNLKRLAEMLGWAKRMVRGEWRKSPRGRAQMVGYKTHDLRPETMASVEWAALLSGDPALEMDWIKRAVDGAIRHRYYEGQEQQGRGPMALVRDESGSMSGAPHSLAVAIEWSLLEIARRDKRGFFSIPFSGQGQYHVWEAPSSNEPDPNGLLHHLSHFYGGGTEPYAPLVKALELIQSHNLRADILMITDDDFAEPPPEFMRRLAETKQRNPLRIVVVVVGAGGDQAWLFADKVVLVNDLVQDRAQLCGAVADIV